MPCHLPQAAAYIGAQVSGEAKQLVPLRHRASTLSVRRHGFSLTELLVATTLLITITAGAINAFSRAQSARRDAGQIQQLHERAQYVFASLEPELQLAGYFGGSAPAPLSADDIPEPAQRCGADLVRRIDLPLQAWSAWQLPCEARGNGALEGSHVLVVRRLSSHLAQAPEPGRAQWLSDLTDPHRWSLHWNGEAPWNLELPGPELRNLIVRIYYVAHAADGGEPTPALRVKSLTSIAGVPAFVDTEVMPGVEDLQIELLPSPAAPRAVRVHLRLRGDTASLRDQAAPDTLEVMRHFSLRNTD